MQYLDPSRYPDERVLALHQPELLNDCVNPLLPPVLGHAPVHPDPGHELQVLSRGEGADEEVVLHDVGGDGGEAVRGDRIAVDEAGSLHLEAASVAEGEGVEEGRLAGAGRAHDGHEFAWTDIAGGWRKKME